MRDCDILEMRKVWPTWKEIVGNINSILIHSPCEQELKLVTEIFSNVKIKICDEHTWNLNKMAYPSCVDIVIMSNVFMYSKDPWLWFVNVLKSCKWFFLMDNIRALRDNPNELGSDGDSLRFMMSACKENPRIHNSFDLCLLEDNLVLFHPFDIHRPEDRAFLSLIRGYL